MFAYPVTYDPDADALYITVHDAPIASQVSLTPDIIVDETADHRLVGLEILTPADNWPLARTLLAQHGYALDLPANWTDPIR
ncbi:MAG: hypothetical protein C7B44_12425 [Sulfobacillus thermosulfidooxidans]|nr:MAG: hypothetical protein C7B44_12425 [Sulfobacillus thermosulfidooxidans]